jgi:hypothetical protein
MRPQRITLIPSAALAVAIGLAGCAGGVEAQPTRSPSVAPPTLPISPEDPMTTTAVSITVNGTTVHGLLDDNPATASLLEQLPLDLTFSDFGGQEKLAQLPAPLVLNGMPAGSGAQPGTIGYYAPDQVLVLYYDTVGYFAGIVPLGTFDDVATVRDAATFTGSVAHG